MGIILPHTSINMSDESLADYDSRWCRECKRQGAWEYKDDDIHLCEPCTKTYEMLNYKKEW